MQLSETKYGKKSEIVTCNQKSLCGVQPLYLHCPLPVTIENISVCNNAQFLGNLYSLPPPLIVKMQFSVTTVCIKNFYVSQYTSNFFFLKAASFIKYVQALTE